MPRIEIYDAMNTPYRIDTFEWEAVRAWLAEWAPILGPHPSDIRDYPALRMLIRPLFKWDEEQRRFTEADWNADTRFFDWFEVPWEPDAIMARVEEQRALIDRAKAEGWKFLPAESLSLRRASTSG